MFSLKICPIVNPRERFLYEYNFFDQWEHEIRVEQIHPFDSQKQYPLCIGGPTRPPLNNALTRRDFWL